MHLAGSEWRLSPSEYFNLLGTQLKKWLHKVFQSRKVFMFFSQSTSNDISISVFIHKTVFLWRFDTTEWLRTKTTDKKNWLCTDYLQKQLVSKRLFEDHVAADEAYFNKSKVLALQVIPNWLSYDQLFRSWLYSISSGRIFLFMVRDACSVYFSCLWLKHRIICWR